MNAPRLRASLVLAMSSILVPMAVLGQEPPTGPEGEAQEATEERPPALTHVHHVSVTFRGTPENQGLLPTAVAEAEIAHQHASLALRNPDDVASVRRHVGHVLHALDPSTTEGGPGLGYGAVRAAERTAHYISLAAVADGASDAIRTHSTHIATASSHAAATGDAAIELATEILEATAPPEDEEGDAEGAEDEAGAEEESDDEGAEGTADAAEAAEEGVPAEEEAEAPFDLAGAVSELVALTEAMVQGVDADGDGRIGWQEGEGGMAQATQHLGLLRRAEGLEGS